MGSWGPGIFDSDHACDFIGIHMRQLAEAIDEDLMAAQDPRDHDMHRDCVAIFAILSALVAKIPYARLCIDKKRVRAWRTIYFAWYEERYIPINGLDEVYRRNIENQFSNLLRNLKVEDIEED